MYFAYATRPYDKDLARAKDTRKTRLESILRAIEMSWSKSRGGGGVQGAVSRRFRCYLDRKFSLAAKGSG
jgi:hypothetical protein